MSYSRMFWLFYLQQSLVTKFCYNHNSITELRNAVSRQKYNGQQSEGLDNALATEKMLIGFVNQIIIRTILSIASMCWLLLKAQFISLYVKF